MTGVLRVDPLRGDRPGTATVGARRLGFACDDADGAERAAESVGPATGDSVAVDLQLDPAADAWWRDAAVRLKVGPPLADPQGNTIAAPSQTVLFPSGAGGLAGGFLFGEAW